jgi:hypothetical protein
MMRFQIETVCSFPSSRVSVCSSIRRNQHHQEDTHSRTDTGTALAASMSNLDMDTSFATRPALSRSPSTKGAFFGKNANGRGYDADEENNWAGALTLLGERIILEHSNLPLTFLI